MLGGEGPGGAGRLELLVGPVSRWGRLSVLSAAPDPPSPSPGCDSLCRGCLTMKSRPALPLVVGRGRQMPNPGNIRVRIERSSRRSTRGPHDRSIHQFKKIKNGSYSFKGESFVVYRTVHWTYIEKDKAIKCW